MTKLREQTVRRSDLTQIYDRDFLLQTFGTLEPTLEQRTQWTFHTWRDCRSHALRFNSMVSTASKVRQELRSLGFAEFADYLIMGNEIRMTSAELKAIVLISMRVLEDDCIV